MWNEPDPMLDAVILDRLRSYCMGRSQVIRRKLGRGAAADRWLHYAAQFERERDDVIRAAGLPPFCRAVRP